MVLMQMKLFHKKYKLVNLLLPRELTELHRDEMRGKLGPIEIPDSRCTKEQ
jgi:hypothetical protein